MGVAMKDYIHRFGRAFQEIFPALPFFAVTCFFHSLLAGYLAMLCQVMAGGGLYPPPRTKLGAMVGWGIAFLLGCTAAVVEVMFLKIETRGGIIFLFAFGMGSLGEVEERRSTAEGFGYAFNGIFFLTWFVSFLVLLFV